jgi:hypothetical protein
MIELVKKKFFDSPISDIYSGKFKNNSLEIVLERMSYTERFEYEIMKEFITIKFLPYEQIKNK